MGTWSCKESYIPTPPKWLRKQGSFLHFWDLTYQHFLGLGFLAWPSVWSTSSPTFRWRFLMCCLWSKDTAEVSVISTTCSCVFPGPFFRFSWKIEELWDYAVLTKHTAGNANSSMPLRWAHRFRWCLKIALWFLPLLSFEASALGSWQCEARTFSWGDVQFGVWGMNRLRCCSELNRGLRFQVKQWKPLSVGGFSIAWTHRRLWIM